MAAPALDNDLPSVEDVRTKIDALRKESHDRLSTAIARFLAIEKQRPALVYFNANDPKYTEPGENRLYGVDLRDSSPTYVNTLFGREMGSTPYVVWRRNNNEPGVIDGWDLVVQEIHNLDYQILTRNLHTMSYYVGSLFDLYVTVAEPRIIRSYRYQEDVNRIDERLQTRIGMLVFERFQYVSYGMEMLTQIIQDIRALQERGNATDIELVILRTYDEWEGRRFQEAHPILEEALSRDPARLIASYASSQPFVPLPPLPPSIHLDANGNPLVSNSVLRKRALEDSEEQSAKRRK